MSWSRLKKIPNVPRGQRLVCQSSENAYFDLDCLEPSPTEHLSRGIGLMLPKVTTNGLITKLGLSNGVIRQTLMLLFPHSGNLRPRVLLALKKAVGIVISGELECHSLIRYIANYTTEQYLVTGTGYRKLVNERRDGSRG